MAPYHTCRQRVNPIGPSAATGRAAALKFLWAWPLLLLPAAASLAAADPWKHAKIMPRDEQAWLMVGGGYVGGVRDVSWPATATRRDGQWLWISDRSGYRRGSVEGWIKIDDVLKLADSQDYYSRQLQTAPTGALYWLRGITWEASGDKDVARIDFQQAVDMEDTLTDAHVRLGRLEADEGLPRAAWEAHFARASQLSPNSPQVHFSWAEALRGKFSGDEQQATAQPGEKPGRPTAVLKKGAAGPGAAGQGAAVQDGKQSAADERFQCFCDARAKFTRAKACDPSWPYTHLGYGQLLLAKAQAAMKEKLRALTKGDAGRIRLDGKSKDKLDAATKIAVEADLAKAVAEFNEAIQWDPQAVDAYRDRGEAYRLQNALGPAMRSADKACKMLDYRASYSLAVLAAVYYDSSGTDNDPDKIAKAITFATKAAQFAQSDKARQFKEDRDFYIEQLGKRPNTTLRTPGAMIGEELPSRGNFDDTASAVRQTGPGDGNLPAPRQVSSPTGISEDAGKIGVHSATPPPPTAGPRFSTTPPSAGDGAKRTFYAIPDLIPQPLGGLPD